MEGFGKQLAEELLLKLKKQREGQERQRLAEERKAIYRKKRADNEAKRKLILSVLPPQRSKQSGLKCGEIAELINKNIFDYRKKIEHKKISEMLKVLKVQGKAKAKNSYWKKTVPKS